MFPYKIQLQQPLRQSILPKDLTLQMRCGSALMTKVWTSNTFTFLMRHIFNSMDMSTSRTTDFGELKIHIWPKFKNCTHKKSAFGVQFPIMELSAHSFSQNMSMRSFIAKKSSKSFSQLSKEKDKWINIGSNKMALHHIVLTTTCSWFLVRLSTELWVWMLPERQEVALNGHHAHQT